MDTAHLEFAARACALLGPGAALLHRSPLKYWDRYDFLDAQGNRYVVYLPPMPTTQEVDAKLAELAELLGTNAPFDTSGDMASDLPVIEVELE